MLKIKSYTIGVFLVLGIAIALMSLPSDLGAKNKSKHTKISKKPKSKKITKKIPKKPIPAVSQQATNKPQSLESRISSLIAGVLPSGTKYGISIYSLTNKKYIYEMNAEQAFTPASTTKFITTFSAFHTLGADFQIKTGVYTDGVVKDGVLAGNLYIFGRGDALLSITDIEDLAEQVKSKGIKAVNGNVYADGTFFDGISERMRYSGDKDVVEPIPPVTALTLDRNTATVLVNSGSSAGQSVSVQVFPSSEAFSVNNSAKVATTRIKKSKKATVIVPAKKNSKKNQKRAGILPLNTDDETCYWLHQVGDAPKSKKAASSGIRFSTNIVGNKKQVFGVSGTLPSSQSRSMKYNIKYPEIVVAGALKQRLELFGVKINGTYGEKQLPDSTHKTTLLAEVGRPLFDIIKLTNKNSDNYLAENIFKMIGAFAGNRKNNSAGAKGLYANIMKKYKIDDSKNQLNDGSGLCRKNLVTPRALVSLLEVANHEAFGALLDSSLSIAGVDGTLKKRMTGSPAENNVHAKTGTLGNASCLTGYLTSSTGEKIAFAFMFNGTSVGTYKHLEDELCKLLANGTNP